MADFNLVLLEGVFRPSGDQLVVEPDDKSVQDALLPLLGQDIYVALHHLPPMPPIMDKWGGGCCLWQPNLCPAGHHLHPDRILNVKARGILGYNSGQWSIQTLEGFRVPLPLELLAGHQARILAATVFEVARMRDLTGNVIADAVPATTVQDLVKQHE